MKSGRSILYVRQLAAVLQKVGIAFNESAHRERRGRDPNRTRARGGEVEDDDRVTKQGVFEHRGSRRRGSSELFGCRSTCRGAGSARSLVNAARSGTIRNLECPGIVPSAQQQRDRLREKVGLCVVKGPAQVPVGHGRPLRLYCANSCLEVGEGRGIVASANVSPPPFEIRLGKQHVAVLRCEEGNRAIRKTKR